MKALILAAGIGSRLRPITNTKPKTLVEVNNKPILSYALEALEENSIKDIIICVGFFSELVINYCEATFPSLHFTFVINHDYETTNNMYSLYLASKYFTEDMIIMNGDVVFASDVIKDLKKTKGSMIAVDRAHYFEESMKVVTDNKNVITHISKKITKDESYACSIDIYKIVQKDLIMIKNEMKRIIEDENELNQWTEVMLDNLFTTGKLIAKPLDILGKKWVEVDNFADLANAEKTFSVALNNLHKKKIYFIDRDGTITLGKSKIVGANDLIQILKKKRKKFYIITNNSSRTPQQHLQMFKQAGLAIKSKNILVSTQSVLQYFQEKKITNVFWVANKRVSKFLSKQGLIFDKKSPQALLLTYDDEIHFAKVVEFSQFVTKGVAYYATHTDMLCPVQNGFVPDIGTFIEMIYATTGKKPNKTFGKPEKSLIDYVLRKEKLSYNDTVIIGDRLYTDMKLAEESEITSILVLSGETKRDLYENASIKADIVVNSVADITAHI